MFKTCFGEMSKFRVFSYVLLLILLSWLGDLVSKELRFMTFCVYLMALGCFIFEAMTPEDTKKEK